MMTRENKAMRLASVLFVLTLLATCLTAGTFANYTTGKEGKATARVAKFGVKVTADADNIFGDKYDANGVASADEDTVTVKADTDVVAPGTNGSMKLSVTGTPETKVKLEVTVNSTERVKLVTNTYTTNAGDKTVDTDYYPVKWTLKQGNQAVQGCDKVSLNEINEYFAGASFTKEYPAGTDLRSIDYTLSWAWAYAGNEIEDTILGDISADSSSVTKADGKLTEGDDYNLNEAFDFEIKVTQVD